MLPLLRRITIRLYNLMSNSDESVIISLMREFYHLEKEKRKEIIDKIRDILYKKEDIIFAYIYGSFLDNLSFRDIDIGIFFKEVCKEDLSDIEFSLAKEISSEVNLPFEIIDLRILNGAKRPFLNSIFRTGLLLFSRDDEFLSNLIEETSLEAISNEYISYLSLKELLP